MNENKEAVQAQTLDGGVTPEQLEAWKNKQRLKKCYYHMQLDVL